MKKILLIILILNLMILSLNAETGLRTNVINWLARHNLSKEWIVLIISMLPVIELRGAIPVGIFLFKFTWIKAAALAIIGNILPIPLVLLFMDGVVSLLRKTRWGVRFTDWLFKRTRNKGKVIERYEALGLTIFVGIPLPGTGGWTGAIAARIFGLRFWKSMLFIFLGILLAACAVVLLCQAGLVVAQ